MEGPLAKLSPDAPGPSLTTNRTATPMLRLQEPDDVGQELTRSLGDPALRETPPMPRCPHGGVSARLEHRGV